MTTIPVPTNWDGEPIVVDKLPTLLPDQRGRPRPKLRPIEAGDIVTLQTDCPKCDEYGGIVVGGTIGDPYGEYVQCDQHPIGGMVTVGTARIVSVIDGDTYHENYPAEGDERTAMAVMPYQWAVTVERPS